LHPMLKTICVSCLAHGEVILKEVNVNQNQLPLKVSFIWAASD
jgi:hypothetical protein